MDLYCLERCDRVGAEPAAVQAAGGRRGRRSPRRRHSGTRSLFFPGFVVWTLADFTCELFVYY